MIPLTASMLVMVNERSLFRFHSLMMWNLLKLIEFQEDFAWKLFAEIQFQLNYICDILISAHSVWKLLKKHKKSHFTALERAKLIANAKIAKIVNLASFLGKIACAQTELPDRSTVNQTNIDEKCQNRKFKWDFLEWFPSTVKICLHALFTKWGEFKITFYYRNETYCENFKTQCISFLWRQH